MIRSLSKASSEHLRLAPVRCRVSACFQLLEICLLDTARICPEVLIGWQHDLLALICASLSSARRITNRALPCNSYYLLLAESIYQLRFLGFDGKPIVESFGGPPGSLILW